MIGRLCRFGRHRLIPGVIQQPGEQVVAEKCLKTPRRKTRAKAAA